MKAEKRLALLLFTIVGIFQLSVCAQQACNECLATNGVACHTETVFSLCNGDAPSLNYITCPRDYVCSIGPQVCYPKSEAPPACVDKFQKGECRICRNGFACLSESQAVRCIDNVMNFTYTHNCKENTVCNTNFANICQDSSQVQPLCRIGGTVTEIPTTTTKPIITTSKPTNPEFMCAESHDVFIPDLNDPTCNRFYFCVLSGNNWHAIPRSCSNSTSYFDRNTKSCISQKPEYCL